ncbi:PepSY domain-containing protein [Dyella caseinilytica]|uniref:PepSY domain-containing protein n=1 Tax=Dyella caseinilytica TaxID=1849581 RepID=A0ABX7H041_9GAMM|nr:PepSY domain-containing protein [Dyella caseinilytica]QRN55648.1 PepSY domain-containing protein [Dyella caseinilytica]GGA03405.1 hypothetical protein GCM10011408_26140 [Dyella caseinilytica]
MSKIRLWHAYVGLFSAPTILFFAFTGALQLFDLHEQHGNYQPPALIEKLGRMHKDQVFALDHHEHQSQAPTSEGKAATPPPDDDDAVSLPTQALKWFFLLVALNLVASTLLGVWIGLSHVRRKRTAWTLLVAGTLIPLGLAWL